MKITRKYFFPLTRKNTDYLTRVCPDVLDEIISLKQHQQRLHRRHSELRSYYLKYRKQVSFDASVMNQCVDDMLEDLDKLDKGLLSLRKRYNFMTFCAIGFAICAAVLIVDKFI